MKTFEDVQQHSSYQALPLKVQEVLKISFRDPANIDLLAALWEVSPRAREVSRDIQLDTIRKVLTLPGMQTLLAWMVFDINLAEMENAPPLPSGQGNLL